jgi:hypothetical protein
VKTFQAANGQSILSGLSRLVKIALLLQMQQQGIAGKQDFFS